MRRSLFLILTILMSICTWIAYASAAEGKRIMVLPVKAKNLGMEQEVTAFTALLQEYFVNQPQMVLLSEDQLETLLGNATGSRQQLIGVAGEQLNCQAALLITLERFRERLGISPLPDLYLVAAARGHLPVRIGERFWMLIRLVQ